MLDSHRRLRESVRMFGMTVRQLAHEQSVQFVEDGRQGLGIWGSLRDMCRQSREFHPSPTSGKGRCLESWHLAPNLAFPHTAPCGGPVGCQTRRFCGVSVHFPLCQSNTPTLAAIGTGRERQDFFSHLLASILSCVLFLPLPQNALTILLHPYF